MIARLLPLLLLAALATLAALPARAEEGDNRSRRILRGAADPELKSAGIGTGFFVSPDGRLLTNAHVIKGCRDVTVETADGAAHPARVEGTDAALDLALVALDRPSPAVARFRDQVSLDGRAVAAIGYPLDGLPRIRAAATAGLLAGQMIDADHFAFRADVRQGNSGGPLVDGAGLVVGIVFAKDGRLGRDRPKTGFAVTTQAAARFLARWNLALPVGEAGPTADSQALLEAARPYVARLVCWR